MKKGLEILMLFITLLFLSGCSDINREAFSYFNGYNDTEKKYFDEYALVYENNEINLSLFSVKSNKMLDNNNHPYINYILMTNIEKAEGVNLTCGNHSLYSGYHAWIEGGNKYYLISGQEISDYCQEYTDFELSIYNTDFETDIKIYKDGVFDDLEWNSVSEVNESNTIMYINQNQELFLYALLIIILVLIIIFIYRFVYKRNLNNFLKGNKVRKLPELSTAIIVSVVICFVAIVILVGTYDDKINKYDNNFYNYELKENSVNYLSEFINHNYELLSSNDRQEVYLEKSSDDEITFYFVLIDNEKRYYLDALVLSYPGAADFDTFHIELYDKETDYNGLLLGNIVECFKLFDGEEVSQFALSFGVTRGDGRIEFVDFNTENIYYKNAKGYYRVHILNDEYTEN